MKSRFELLIGNGPDGATGKVKNGKNYPFPVGQSKYDRPLYTGDAGDDYLETGMI